MVAICLAKDIICKLIGRIFLKDVHESFDIINVDMPFASSVHDFEEHLDLLLIWSFHNNLIKVLLNNE